MKKRNLRKIAFMLLLVQALSNLPATEAHAANERQYYRINEEGKLEIVDDFNILLNHHTTTVEDGEKISIFNEKNLSSRQYGGDQRTFERNYKNLIKDPYIWNEMQKCFPVEEFESEQAAMDFYHQYFKAITASGCGYVAIANKVFKHFEGKEKEFEKIFGYPMYKVDEEGKLDFNYEYFVLEFFNFSSLYPDYSQEKKDEFKAMFAKTIADIEYQRYIYSEEYRNRPLLNHNLTMDEVQEIIRIRDKERELYQKSEKAIDESKTLGIPVDIRFGHIVEFLKTHGIQSKLVLQKNNLQLEQGDILASEKFTLYKEEDGEKYSISSDIEPHCVSVVSTDGGQTIVSSWGEKYVFDDQGADWTVEVDLKIYAK